MIDTDLSMLDSIKSCADESLVRNNDFLINSTGTGKPGRLHIYQKNLNYDIVVCDSHVTILRIIKIYSFYIF